MIPKYKIPHLPIREELETRAILKKLAVAHRFLAELNGMAQSIPNQSVLLSTLALQEANKSTAVENIVTTQDEVFKSSIELDEYASPAAKEVSRYFQALLDGFDHLQATKGAISQNVIISMYQSIKATDAGFRNGPGTHLKNQKTGEVDYVPPQSLTDIKTHMGNLENYINTDVDSETDPLVKLAIIHHQFESIHPFTDGNGRVGRLLNVLYLVQQDLLDLPILYLSRYITQNKDSYYSLLNSTRDTGDWGPWIIFILDGIIETSQFTTGLIVQIRSLMAEMKNTLRENHKKIYSQDLLNNLFRHPYTRIEFVQTDLDISKATAIRYLDALSESGVVEKHRRGRKNYYINRPLVDLFMDQD
ncbi:MAG: Fic/DOC family N-terminal domain-containing protein [Pseudomonadota bacterium]